MTDRRYPSFDEVGKAALSACPALLQRWLPQGELDGREFVIGDVAGNPGDSCKINVETGKWADFAADQQGGDLISLYAAVYGYDNMGRACRDLADELGVAPRVNGHSYSAAQPAAGGGKKKTWRPQHPVPSKTPSPDFTHHKHGQPSATWFYLDAEGRLIGYVCRFDKSNGGKEIVPLSYCRDDDGNFAWRWLSFAKPRPLYGLAELATRPDANVIVTEGEKDADAARRLFPSQVVVTWPGGSKAHHLANWSPLEGRKVVLWPDADEPGRQCMDGWVDDKGVWQSGIAQLLSDKAAGVRVIVTPEDVKKGWGAADLEAEGVADPMAWLRQRLRAPTDPPAAPEDMAPAPEDYGIPADYDDGPGVGPLDTFAGAPFRVLGYNRDTFYYYPYGAGQIIELAARSHKKENLMRLARLQWWELEFPSKNGCDWSAATNALFRAADAKGIFNPSSCRRGRGIWFDQGRAVFNLGDRLIVDGDELDFRELTTRYVYEAGEPLTAELHEPLKASEAARLLEICQDIKWVRGISAHLLAGWIMIAPLSGALHWRPHIWITGPAHSGKSTVINDIVRRVLGALAFNFEGQSSESALRQRMENDALPVVFDESEQNDEQSRKLIQSVINLARISSSGGFVYKGTQNQSGAKAYLARSCMCLSSVNLTLQHYQDETRFTPLSTAKIDSRDPEQKELNEAHFQELSRKIVEVLTPEFSNRLFIRAVKLLPTILKNADVFGQAAASYLGNRRVGDQLGAMLAGAYALAKGREVTFDEAYEWVSEKDWSEHTPADAERNEEKLLNTIMQYPTRVQAGNGGLHDRTLGDLVDAARDKDEGVPRDTAEKALKRFGIRYQRQHLAESTVEGVYVSTSHTMLKRVLKDTPWGTNWREPLLQVEGAEKSASAVRFGAGAVTRAVWIPVTAFDTS